MRSEIEYVLQHSCIGICKHCRLTLTAREYEALP